MNKVIMYTCFCLAALASCATNERKKNDDNFVVLVKYKSQSGKAGEARSALLRLLEKVKKEPNYVSIKLHIDPSDNTNILLYEEWTNEEYYKGEHMNTQHLLQFMNEARSFLAGPPEITFWKKHSE